MCSHSGALTVTAAAVRVQPVAGPAAALVATRVVSAEVTTAGLAAAALVAI